MSRFQALTNRVLDAELEMLRDRLGLAPSQKADLLREVAAIASWAVRQAELGRTIEARSGSKIERLAHPALERLQTSKGRSSVERVVLTNDEVLRLAAVLDRGFDPPAALRRALLNLSNSSRRPPKLRWKRSAA